MDGIDSAGKSYFFKVLAMPFYASVRLGCAVNSLGGKGFMGYADIMSSLGKGGIA